MLVIVLEPIVCLGLLHWTVLGERAIEVKKVEGLILSNLV